MRVRLYKSKYRSLPFEYAVHFDRLSIYWRHYSVDFQDTFWTLPLYRWFARRYERHAARRNKSL